jgi:hypothetical protein
MKTYRTAFLVALAGNVLLAGALGFYWWRSHAGEGTTLRSVLPAAIRSVLPESLQPMPQNAAVPAPAVAPAEPALVPVQISPQRLQSIGVKLGRVINRYAAPV